MRIEWLLTKLDKEVRAYTDLRAQLNASPAASERYTTTEAALSRQIVRLRDELSDVLAAIAANE